MGRLFLVLIAIPVLEIFVYIQLIKITGIWLTLALIFGTGLIGAFLAKREGFQVIQSIKQDLNHGQMPGNKMLEGLLVLAGGILLLTPGLISDITGLVFLLPPSRVMVREFIKRKLRQMIDNGQVNFYIRY